MLNKKIKWFQLSQRQRMSPFPNYFSMECITWEMKKVIGYAYREIITIFQENIMYVFADKKDHERVGRAILKKVVAEPEIFMRLAKKQKQFAAGFYSFLKKNNRSSLLKEMSDKQFARLQQEYERRYKQVYSHYFPVLAMEIYFFEYLRNYLHSLEPDAKKAAKYVDVLITERKAMINRQEKVAALQLCQSIKNNPHWLVCFRPANAEEIIKLVGQDKSLLKLIKKHEQRFFWITRDYDDPVLTLADFISRFRAHVAGNPAKILEKLNAEEEQLSTEQKDIYRRLGIDKHHQRLFQTMRDGIYYKELRKWIVSQTLYYYDPILSEIARQGALSLRQARHLMTSEIQPMLAERIDMSQTLNERIKLCVFHGTKGTSAVYTGKEAEQYYNFLVKVDPHATTLFGMPVSSGKVSGPVKIVINPDAFHKVKKGDIIATLQATPVFSPVLSIAAGLICDGGSGITSHPATLAREAGIPGVIGLRMATKILKDGEMVEVDGDKGVVTILK